jgi:hypothetical protein
MKRLFAILFSLALIGASVPAPAQVGGLAFPGPGMAHSTGGGGGSVTRDVNAGAFQNVVTVSGGASGHDVNGITGVSTTAASGILVAFVYVADTSGLSAINDGGAGLTWVKRGSTQSNSDSTVLEMWYATFSSAVTSDSMQFVTVNAAKFVNISVQAFTGNNASTPWDANGALPSHSTTAASITTSHATDMLLGMSYTPGVTPGGGAGWTVLATNNAVLVEVKQVSATQSGVGLGATGGTIDGEIGDALQSP